MAFENGGCNGEISVAFMELLQNDFKNLAVESKKKYPLIKEVTHLVKHIFINLQYFSHVKKQLLN